MTDTVTLESLGASLNWEAESQGAEAATQESWWHQRGGGGDGQMGDARQDGLQRG